MRTLYLLSLILGVCMAGAKAQESVYSPQLWQVIEDRWRDSQPVIVAYTKSGEVVAGQQIHASSDSLYIYPNDGLPIGDQWAGDLIMIRSEEIDSVLFQAGGNRLIRDKRANTLIFPSSNAHHSKSYLKIREESVYEDSLVTATDLEVAIKRSKVMKKAFRKKRIRYSMGVSFGSDVVLNDIQKMLEESGLPQSYESYGGYVNGEFLDLSFRVTNRLILGGSVLTRNSYTSVYSSSYNQTEDIYYNLDVDYREHKIYAEYAIVKTDRFFSRRFEVLAGAGLLMGIPEWRFNFSYYNVEDLDNIFGGDYSSNYDDLILGLQLKGAFHYYFLPGVSIWTALDLNLTQPFVVPEQEILIPGIEEAKLLPEHELGFNSVRFKLGLSIYF